ncbi:uncharacterized protein [Ptychodera flava]|uniref:uncharacterized protein n=1 Tax=Ptychodera flava TaxID=63121 RepID=UPI00396A68A3
MLKKRQFLEERLAFESRGRKKLRPTLKLKNTVHTIYNGLVENGQTWDTSKPFGHAINVEINDEIKKALNNQVSADEAVIQVAMKTYFLTKRKEETVGKWEDGCIS